MTINALKKELELSKNPIAKSLHHNSGFRVLVVGFKKGMVMKEHRAKWLSKLTVLQGGINYKEGEKEIELHQFDEYDIPVNILHSVKAYEDSLCLLTQSNEGI